MDITKHIKEHAVLGPFALAAALAAHEADVANPHAVTTAQLGLTAPMDYKGAIAVNTDFPTAAAVSSGDFYTITTNVTDDDATRTNTGQSFTRHEEIVWNGVNWTNLGFSGYGNTITIAVDTTLVAGVGAVFVDLSGGNVLLELPAAVGALYPMRILVYVLPGAANTLTIDGNTNSLYLYDQALTSDQMTLTQQGAYALIETDGTSYYIVDINLGPEFIKRTVVSTATYDTALDDYILGVTRTAVGACAIELQTADTMSGRCIQIVDEGGGAREFNITVTTEGAETICGEDSFVIDDDYNVVSIYSDGSNWFIG